MQDFDYESRIVAPEYTPVDSDIDTSLRPKMLTEYIGQDKVKENLKIYITAAKQRKESLDHVLLYGPPGLGKTTLAGIIAKEMGVNLRVTSGPAIEKQGDLVAILTSLEEGDVLVHGTHGGDFGILSAQSGGDRIDIKGLFGAFQEAIGDGLGVSLLVAGDLQLIGEPAQILLVPRGLETVCFS